MRHRTIRFFQRLEIDAADFCQDRAVGIFPGDHRDILGIRRNQREFFSAEPFQYLDGKCLLRFVELRICDLVMKRHGTDRAAERIPAFLGESPAVRQKAGKKLADMPEPMFFHN